MNRIIEGILVLFLSLLLLQSCDNRKCADSDKNNINYRIINDSLEKVNRYLLSKEESLINDYLKENQLDTERTGTGLRYMILEKGDGRLINKGDVVVLDYKLSLLSGDVLYSSKDAGYKTFVVGRGGVESGLEEAVLKLHKNDKAILVLPSHLAHGLLGDGNKIPPKATLVYEIKIIDIE